MASDDNLSLTVTGDDPAVIVAKGQIDSHTSTSLQDALAGVEATQPVSVDLAEVTFVDSSGLRVIVRAHKRHVAAGSTLTIVKPSEPVRRLLDITGLTSELMIST